MNLNFTPDDVKEHLVSLGYKNVSEDQLKDFVRDLRRLIRYEEKQKRLQKLMANAEEAIDENDHKTVQYEARRVQQNKIKKVLTKESKTLNYDKKTGNLSMTSDSVSLSYEESQEELDEIRVRVTTRPPAPPFKDLQVGPELKQILPPRPELPTKPTCSFIKPVIEDPKRKNIRHDPVQLHAFYKKHWEKQRLPGEMNRAEKDLRWATREWMSKKS